MKKIMCFTHWDLDGIMSYIVIRWAFPKATVEYMPTTVKSFRENYTKWLSTNELEDYDQVFITDLGVFEDKDLIDHEKIFIIDHHKGHENSTYSKATAIIADYSSACKLAYKTFKTLYNIKVSREQLHLMLLADDYDSYKLELKDSVNLNLVFWETTNKFEEFTKSFINGFRGFTLKQQNMINLHKIKVEKIRSELEVYSGSVTIQGSKRYVCAACTKSCINEVADTLLKDYNAEVAIIINTNTNHASYRRGDSCDTNLAEFARDTAGGYGHEYSSGSEITDGFMEFMKNLDKI
jgi:hypothetical protein